MRTARRLLGPIGICGILALPGCGGGSDGVTTPPSPTPTPGPVRTLVTQGAQAISAPDDRFTYFRTVPFTTPFPGTLEVTVNWTFPTNEVWMYVSSGVCTSQQFTSCPGTECQCQFLVSSEVSTPKPRLLTIPNAPAGSRSLFIWNLGPREESVDFQIYIVN